MISYRQGCQLIEAESQRFEIGNVPCDLADLQGRVLAEPVLAKVNLPAFDNSAMDGFAMCATAATDDIHLPVLNLIAAGDNPGPQENQKGAVPIMTGAPVPDWCETVVPVENVQIGRDADGEPNSICLSGPIIADQHIRRAGQDVQKGQLILTAGHRISAEDVMMLAALGVARAQVLVRPIIALISTGAELVNDPDIELSPGQIRNSNQPYLAASLASWPVEVDALSGHPDEAGTFIPMVERAVASGATMILSTGAVSMGVRDFVPDSLRQLGAKIIFHKCKIRPGKPVLFAVLPNGALFFGLPGNPVSAAVGFRFFAIPALRTLLGLPPQTIATARLSKNFSKRPGFRLFAKARVNNVEGQMQIEVLPGQQSFRIAPLVEANCWAEIPEEAGALAVGELLNYYPFIGKFS